MKYDVIVSKPRRAYRILEGIEAKSPAHAKRLALAASRKLDTMWDATFADLGLTAPCDIGEWGNHDVAAARQRVETVIKQIDK